MPDTIADIARRHGFSSEAARAVAEALHRGGRRMAQFNHPDLGGQGQCIAGGMIMRGDMVHDGLTARGEALGRELASAPDPVPGTMGQQPGPSGHWWPADLGTPSATGGQNDMRYACFPDARRLAVMRYGRLRVYDTGDHRIGGFSQQQSGSQSLTFSSQNGAVRLEDLPEI